MLGPNPPETPAMSVKSKKSMRSKIGTKVKGPILQPEFGILLISTQEIFFIKERPNKWKDLSVEPPLYQQMVKIFAEQTEEAAA